MPREKLKETEGRYIRVSKDVYEKIISEGEFQETFNTVLTRIMKRADSAAGAKTDD